MEEMAGLRGELEELKGRWKITKEELAAAKEEGEELRQ